MDFIDQVKKDVGLSQTEEIVLRSAGIRSSDEMLSVLWNFPSLSKQGMDFLKLKNYAMPKSSPVFMKTAASVASNVAGIHFGRGAHAPPQARLKPGDTLPLPATLAAVPLPTAGAAGGPPPLSGPALDVRPSKPWPVRDQQYRGTCVSFATTALCEDKEIRGGNTTIDLSEQFLFWAAKTKDADPQPTIDGTYLSCARAVLPGLGECEETYWPYSGTPIPGNVTQANSANPSNAAMSNALTHPYSLATYQSFNGGITSGAAATLLNLLRTNNRPVAITVPVFGDPANPTTDNWNTSIGFQIGRVFDPPPLSKVIGGHAVCITGFSPDPTEPTGGYFILRNSWSTVWGSSNPTAGSPAPEAGYGFISGTYIEGHLWELSQL